MFDILCSVWKRPGASSSPIYKLNLSSLGEACADEVISHLHKCGVDTILVYATAGYDTEGGLLESVLAAVERRRMEAVVHDSVMMADMSCSEADIVAYNPMLAAHTLKAVPQDSCELGSTDERVATLYVKRENSVVTETSAESFEDSECFDFILTKADACGADLLSGELTESYYLTLFDAFVEKYAKYLKSTIVGFATDRLLDVTADRFLWSYDMLPEFKAAGGTDDQLVALFLESDKRHRKDAERSYRKALAARVARAFVKPLADKCHRNAIVLMGQLPLDFVGSCAMLMDLPVLDRDHWEKHTDTEGEMLCALKCLSDLSREGGGVGAALVSRARDTKELMREGSLGLMGGAVRVILTEELTCADNLARLSLKAEDMKKVCLALKRLSTVNTASSTESDCAVLCDDGIIPLSGAEKLMKTGAEFSFVSLPLICERAEMVNGEIHLDKFTFRSLLIDGRVRLDPADVMKIGEFAAFGGKMYRSGTFATFAKKNLELTEFDRECARQLLRAVKVKSGNRFVVFSNPEKESVRIKLPFDETCAGYVLDLTTGETSPLGRETQGDDSFTSLKILPESTLVVAYNKNETPTDTRTYFASQIISLHKGDNRLFDALREDERAVVEIDLVSGGYAELSVDGKALRRLVCAPYRIDVTDALQNDAGILTVESDGEVKGAVLRVLSPRVD